MNSQFLREAIGLAREKMQAGCGGPFGAVIVRRGEIIARGWNQVTTANDPTAHAEVVAIREAAHALGSFKLEGCEIYCSCEPCPMCLGAIYWARLDAIYYAGGREDAAQAGFDDALIYRELSVPPARRRVPTRQLMRDEALAVFQEWVAKSDRMPY